MRTKNPTKQKKKTQKISVLVCNMSGGLHTTNVPEESGKRHSDSGTEYLAEFYYDPVLKRQMPTSFQTSSTVTRKKAKITPNVAIPTNFFSAATEQIATMQVLAASIAFWEEMYLEFQLQNVSAGTAHFLPNYAHSWFSSILLETDNGNVLNDKKEPEQLIFDQYFRRNVSELGFLLQHSGCGNNAVEGLSTFGGNGDPNDKAGFQGQGSNSGNFGMGFGADPTQKKMIRIPLKPYLGASPKIVLAALRGNKFINFVFKTPGDTLDNEIEVVPNTWRLVGDIHASGTDSIQDVKEAYGQASFHIPNVTWHALQYPGLILQNGAVFEFDLKNLPRSRVHYLLILPRANGTYTQTGLSADTATATSGKIKLIDIGKDWKVEILAADQTQLLGTEAMTHQEMLTRIHEWFGDRYNLWGRQRRELVVSPTNAFSNSAILIPVSDNVEYANNASLEGGQIVLGGAQEVIRLTLGSSLPGASVGFNTNFTVYAACQKYNEIIEGVLGESKFYQGRR
jgi:hypothetical protein